MIMMNTTANTKFNDRVLFKVKDRLITFQFFFNSREAVFATLKLTDETHKVRIHYMFRVETPYCSNSHVVIDLP